MPHISILWSAPLQVSLCCYFMWREVGAAAFAGVAVIVVAIPINTCVASLTRRLQLEQMKNKDKRINLMNEILSGIKVIKFYGWEASFADQAQAIRNNEIKLLRKRVGLSAILSLIFTFVPFLMGMACFAVYCSMDGGQTLTPSKYI